MGPDGSLWGVAGGGAYDRGSVFRVAPPAGEESAELVTVYSFLDAAAGGIAGPPAHGLVLADDGNFYGLQSERGALYRLTPQGEYELLQVVGADGSCYLTYGPLAFFAGDLYGTCRAGGDPGLPPNQREGTVFRFGLDGTLTRLHTFVGGAAGRTPEAGLTVGADGLLYGTTLYGGIHDAGTIFSLDPASGVVELLHHFNRPVDGSGPTGETASSTAPRPSATTPSSAAARSSASTPRRRAIASPSSATSLARRARPSTRPAACWWSTASSTA